MISKKANKKKKTFFLTQNLKSHILSHWDFQNGSNPLKWHHLHFSTFHQHFLTKKPHQLLFQKKKKKWETTFNLKCDWPGASNYLEIKLTQKKRISIYYRYTDFDPEIYCSMNFLLYSHFNKKIRIFIFVLTTSSLAFKTKKPKLMHSHVHIHFFLIR